MVKLIVTNKDQGVREYELKDGNKLNVGRESSNDIVLNDDRVSRIHASFFVRGLKVYISDLFSRNGTILNGEQVVGDQELFNNDVINLGSSVIVVQMESHKPQYEVNDTTSTGGFTNTKIAAAQFRATQAFTQSQLDLLKNAISVNAGHNVHNDQNWVLAWWHGNSLNRMAEQTVASSVKIVKELRATIPSLSVFIFALSALLEDEEPSWKVNLMGDPIKICEEFNQLLSPYDHAIYAEKSIVHRVASEWKFKELAVIRFKKNLPICELFALENID